MIQQKQAHCSEYALKSLSYISNQHQWLASVSAGCICGWMFIMPLASDEEYCQQQTERDLNEALSQYINR